MLTFLSRACLAAWQLKQMYHDTPRPEVNDMLRFFRRVLIDPIARYLARPEWLTDDALARIPGPEHDTLRPPKARPEATTVRVSRYFGLADRFDRLVLDTHPGDVQELGMISQELQAIWDALGPAEVDVVFAFEKWRGSVHPCERFVGADDLVPVGIDELLGDEVQAAEPRLDEVIPGDPELPADFYTRETLRPAKDQP